MIKVNVIVKDNTWRKYIKNPDIYLKNKLKKIQDDKFFSKNNVYVFSLLLSGTKEIKLLNKKFRKKNKTTDILSFPYQVKRDLKKQRSQKSEVYLGDIIINVKKINFESQKIFKDHFNILWVHGLLHLFGYDHKKEKNYKKMKFFENKFLKKLQ